MRLKVLGLFLLVQLFSVVLWHAVEGNSGDLQASAAAPEMDWDSLKTFVPLSGSGGSSPSLPVSIPMVLSDEEEGQSYKITVRNWDHKHQELYDHQAVMIQRMLAVLPEEHTKNLEIVLDYDPAAHRGWGGKNIVILGAATMSTEEMMSVLVHEVGHHVDAAYLRSTQEKFPSAYRDGKKVLYNDDPSVAFYNISWLGDEDRRAAGNNAYDLDSTSLDAMNRASMDAVSGYAATNPHEDFAETYAFYVLHHSDFKFLSKTDPALKQKYDFMRNVVFRGKEFADYTTSVQTEKRPWDITKLPYDLEMVAESIDKNSVDAQNFAHLQNF